MEIVLLQPEHFFRKKNIIVFTCNNDELRNNRIYGDLDASPYEVNRTSVKV